MKTLKSLLREKDDTEEKPAQKLTAPNPRSAAEPKESGAAEFFRNIKKALEPERVEEFAKDLEKGAKELNKLFGRK